MKRKRVEIWCIGVLALLAAFTLGFFVGSNASQAGVAVSVPEVQPSAPQPVLEIQTAETAPAEGEPDAEPTAQGLLDLNTATQEELEALPGIGEVLAQRILSYRTEYGPFLTVEQIMEVNGIGEKRYEALKEWITVEAQYENSGR